MKKKISALLTCLMAICCSVLLFGCEEIVEHKITASSWDISYGTVSGYGTYKTNYEVTLKATPKNAVENNFIAWIKNDEVVSYDAEYTFIANKDTEGKYIAVFNGTGLDLLVINDVALSFNNLPNDTESNRTLTSISNIKLSYGTTADLLKSIATYADSPIEAGSVSTEINEFELKKAVLKDTSSFTFELTYKTNYINNITNATFSNNISSPKVRIDFSKLKDTDEFENTSISMKKTNSTITVTVKNIKTDSEWGNSSGTLKMEFIKISSLQKPAE